MGRRVRSWAGAGLGAVRVACQVLVLSTLAIAKAHAQPDATELAPASVVDRLLDDAVAEYSQGRFREARTLFERAHALRPSARTLRGLGFSAFQLRQYARALAELEASLQSPVLPLDEALRVQVVELLRRVEPYVARVRVELSPHTALLTLAGVLPPRDPEGRILLDLGHHELKAFAPGYADRGGALDVHQGGELALQLSLAPERTAGDPPRQPALRTLSWVATSVAAVALASSLATWLGAERRFRRLRDHCWDQGGCFEDELARGEIARLDRATWALASVGAASGVAALSVWLLHRHRRPLRERPATASANRLGVEPPPAADSTENHETALLQHTLDVGTQLRARSE